jgi:hypothetical protein
MAQQIAPKADQPRVGTGNLKRGDQPNSLQYKVSGIRSYDRTGNATRGYMRKPRSV